MTCNHPDYTPGPDGPDWDDLSDYSDSELKELKDHLTDISQATTDVGLATAVGAALAAAAAALATGGLSLALWAAAGGLGAISGALGGTATGSSNIGSRIDQELGNRDPNNPDRDKNGDPWDDNPTTPPLPLDPGDPRQDLPSGSTFYCPPVSPLVIDLDGDGIELTSLDGSQAYFDLNVDGFAEQTGVNRHAILTP